MQRGVLYLRALSLSFYRLRRYSYNSKGCKISLLSLLSTYSPLPSLRDFLFGTMAIRLITHTPQIIPILIFWIKTIWHHLGGGRLVYAPGVSRYVHDACNERSAKLRGLMWALTAHADHPRHAGCMRGKAAINRSEKKGVHIRRYNCALKAVLVDLLLAYLKAEPSKQPTSSTRPYIHVKPLHQIKSISEKSFIAVLHEGLESSIFNRRGATSLTTGLLSEGGGGLTCLYPARNVTCLWYSLLGHSKSMLRPCIFWAKDKLKIEKKRKHWVVNKLLSLSAHNSSNMHHQLGRMWRCRYYKSSIVLMT